MLQKYKLFLEHCTRVREQYNALQSLKANLLANSVIVQMDFAENFACQSADEIQSAYWNATMVTIHPVFAYFKDDGQLKHKLLAFIFDVNNHNTTAILIKLVPIIKEFTPNVDTVFDGHPFFTIPKSLHFQHCRQTCRVVWGTS